MSVSQPLCAYDHCPNLLTEDQLKRHAKFCSPRCKNLEHQQRRRRDARAYRLSQLAMPFPGPDETMVSGQVVKIADVIEAARRLVEPPMLVSEAEVFDLPETGASGAAWQDRISHA